MGGSLSSESSGYPQATSHFCVLPVRTSGSSHFSITPAPMPSALVGRTTDAEFAALIAGINASLKPLSHFGVSSLMVPFLLVDLIAMLTLCAIDPAILLTPWEYEWAELALPLLIEFGAIFCSFPLISWIFSRRIARVQHVVVEHVHNVSMQYADRGLHLTLKGDGVSRGGELRGSGVVVGSKVLGKLWVEVQVFPFLKVLAPKPVPTYYPVLAPTAEGGGEGGARGEGGANVGTVRGGGGGSLDLNDASGAEGSSSCRREQVAAEVHAAAGAGAGLSQLQVEYLRSLQENQMLRQYLSQYQHLVALLTEHARRRAAADTTDTIHTAI